MNVLRSSTLIALAALLSMGCSSEKDDAKSHLSDAELEARLVKADAVDGETDHVVHKCYVCALGMDGKEELAVEHRGYQVHLCNPKCKEVFEKSGDKVIATVKIPKSKD